MSIGYIYPLWRSVYSGPFLFFNWIKKFFTAKETINKMKRQPSEWENVFVNDTFDKGLISKIYRGPQFSYLCEELIGLA